MKAAVLKKPFKIEIQEVEKPKVRDNEVLIEVIEAGVCGSDLHTYEGVHPFRKPPVILGHEVSGNVCKLGSKVTGIDIGTKVAVEPLISCGECSFCRQGRYNICPERIVPGVAGWKGTFAEYFATPAERVYPLKNNVSYTSGVLAEPIAVGLHAARRVNIKDNSTLVIGLGPVGIGAAVSAKILGSKQVIATDIAEINLKVAKELGIDQTINVSKEDLRTKAKEFVPEGFDSVIVATGYPKAIEDAIALTRRCASIVVVSLFTKSITTSFSQFVLQEKEIFGSSAYIKSDFEIVVNWLNDGKLKPDSMATHKMPLEKASKALEILHKRNEPVIKIILKPKP